MVYKVITNKKGDFVNPLEEAVKQLVSFKNKGKNTQAGTLGYNAIYGGVGPKQIDIYEYPCHHYMGQIHKGAKVVFSKFMIPELETYKYSTQNWFDWITSKNSPWKIAFDLGMSKKDKSIFNEKFWFENGFIFDSLNTIPSNVLHNFLVASRISKEWPSQIKIWDYYCKSGLSPEMSLIMTSVFKSHDQDPRNKTRSIQSLTKDQYDWPVDFVYGLPEMVDRFVHHKMDPLSFRPPYSESHLYTPVNRVWGGYAIDPGTFIDSRSPPNKKESYGTIGLDSKKHNSLLYNLYSDKFGKVGSIKTSFSSIWSWSLSIDEIIEIGKLEDKRVRGL